MFLWARWKNTRSRVHPFSSMSQHKRFQALRFLLYWESYQSSENQIGSFSIIFLRLCFMKIFADALRLNNCRKLFENILLTLIVPTV